MSKELTADHIGKMIRVRDSKVHPWKERIFHGYNLRTVICRDQLVGSIRVIQWSYGEPLPTPTEAFMEEFKGKKITRGGWYDYAIPESIDRYDRIVCRVNGGEVVIPLCDIDREWKLYVEPKKVPTPMEKFMEEFKGKKIRVRQWGKGSYIVPSGPRSGSETGFEGKNEDGCYDWHKIRYGDWELYVEPKKVTRNMTPKELWGKTLVSLSGVFVVNHIDKDKICIRGYWKTVAELVNIHWQLSPSGEPQWEGSVPLTVEVAE